MFKASVKKRDCFTTSGILNLVPCHKLYVLDSGTWIFVPLYFWNGINGEIMMKYGCIFYCEVEPRMNRN